MSRLFAPALLLMPLSLAAGPPSAPPAPGGCRGGHFVVRGDTLYSIARRCHSTIVAIAQASRLADPRRIEIGQLLIIPGPADVPQPMAAMKPEPAREPMPALAYRFQPGDTVYSLARWARTSVPALFAANPGLDPRKIEIGDEIRLPAGAAPPEPGRRREFGTGPGPALVRPELLRHIPAAAPLPQARPLPPPPAPRARDPYMGPRPRHAPPPPPRAKPDEGPDTPGL
jgi:LysM repeat protein